MKNNLVKKALVVSTLLLFFGVAFAPSINQSVVTASTDDDLVEVTTQACGIQGYDDTTVKLTQQQYQDLGQYLVEFRARLNQTSTREEAIPIFKEAVVVLDRYGLLPKGLSVEKAQKYVIGGFQNQPIMKLAEKVYNQDRRTMVNDRNFLCLVTGSVDNSLSISPLTIARGAIAFFFWNILSNFVHIDLTLAIFRFAFRMPLDVIGIITFGSGQLGTTPSSGLVYSVGLAGNKKWNGSLLGHYPIEIDIPDGTGFNLYVGVIGFIGIKIFVLDETKDVLYNNFFGSALMVGIDEVLPT